jgi:hypothetical protein
MIAAPWIIGIIVGTAVAPMVVALCDAWDAPPAASLLCGITAGLALCVLTVTAAGGFA